MEAENESGSKEEYFMLAHELPEDQSLRDKLQRERLVIIFIMIYRPTTCYCFAKLTYSLSDSIIEFGFKTAAKGEKRWRLFPLLSLLQANV